MLLERTARLASCGLSAQLRPGCGSAVSHEARKRASVTPAPPGLAREPSRC